MNSLCISRKKIQYFFWLVFFALTFRTFESFPGMAPIKELWQVMFFGFTMFGYLYFKALSGWKTTPFELYIIIVISAIPILSGVAAWREFGQPLIYGLLSQRMSILSMGALIVILAFQTKMLSLKGVEKTLIFLAWGTLGLYFFMTIFIAPSLFVNIGNGFVGGSAESGYAFKFRTEFIIFGFFFYAFQGLRFRSIKFWVLSSPFLGYMLLVEGGRSLILAVLGSFAFFIYRWSSHKRLLLFAPKLMLFSLMFLSLLYVMNASYVAEVAGKFGDAFTVVATGEKSEDVSANARIVETLVAIPYISKHWLIGNGSISNQWHGGYEEVLGAYFYPSDIGIIGVMYMYGLFGTSLYLVQFIFAYLFSKRIAAYKFKSPLLDAVKAFLLYFLLHSFVTGRFAHYSEVSFVFVAILSCIALEAKNNYLFARAQGIRL